MGDHIDPNPDQIAPAWCNFAGRVTNKRNISFQKETKVETLSKRYDIEGLFKYVY